MSQVNLHVSNRLDLLAEALAKVTAKPQASPFTPEIVVVQSAAARRWLGMRIAELQGVCANFEFPFLGEMVCRLVATAQDGETPCERPAPDLLTWRIESALRRCAGKPEFEAVAGYLAGGDSLKRFSLAARLAGLFDQYRVYRPELLLKWTARGAGALAGDEAWQARLWLDVDGASDFDRRLAKLRADGFSRAIRPPQLPARLSIFAPASLAPAYLDLLFQLGRVSEVHLFILSPSPVYHGADLTPKARARLGSKSVTAGETGNPLLASWGKAAAELTDLLLETEERLEVPTFFASEQFQSTAPTNLLTALQHRIFLASATGPDEGSDRDAVRRDDHSLVLNACHSPMREVEVLYDQLLDCFARDPDLRPRDILVVTPAIEKYAPLIRAVFEYPEDESLRIPYTIADRHPRSESVPIDLFLTLLNLAGSRYTAPDIFLLLSSRSLRRRFGVTDDDLALIRGWIEATAIRWGIDAPHTETKGVPPMEANTWRHGLDRLLLGFAMEGKERQLFAGILPQDDVEGDGAQTLGRFLTAVEALFAIEARFQAARPLAAWTEPLLQVVADFFEPIDSQEAEDVRYLRFVIERLGTLAESGPEKEAVDFQAVRQFLEDQVGAMEQRGSFLSGGVTFCALKPVRSIPARIVCVLGLNDQVFPRPAQWTQFDLMARRRPGDPSPGGDDRLAFLETVLSARSRLLISYLGRSGQDNKKIPPSIVVSELLDYLDEAFEFPDGRAAEQYLVAEHPLHAFSPEYFAGGREGDRLFSYSQANAEASRAIQSGQDPATRPFIELPLPEPPTPIREIELAQLVRFWSNPCEYFIRRRLGFRLGEPEEGLEADEPFSLGAWEQYPIKQELVADRLGFAAGGSPQAIAARGVLPPGAIGKLQLRSAAAEAERFARIVRNHLAVLPRKQPRDIKLALGDLTLSGRLNSLHGDGTLHFRCALLKPKDQLRAWIEHLALCASEERAPHESALIGTDAVISFSNAGDAAGQLATLCRLFLEGTRRPLPFFPAAALAYAEAELDNAADPMKPALQKWKGTREQPGEKSSPYIACCFGAGAPLPEEFVSLAREVCRPLVSGASMQKIG